ncbi:DUF2933 domain-containing protein [Streptomyces sp. B4I13]|uniref:DUF2933 domain-containing protein n=1 Tax=Streptomyces sp. B4I13 TaxID=3042271 RepID=UPI0035947950
MGASLDSLVWLALVAACPLMMFFMMKSMHGHDSGRSGRPAGCSRSRTSRSRCRHPHLPRLCDAVSYTGQAAATGKADCPISRCWSFRHPSVQEPARDATDDE